MLLLAVTNPPWGSENEIDLLHNYCTCNNLLIISSDFQGSFAGSEKRAVLKQMKNTEVKAKINMDELPLAALHKVSTHSHTEWRHYRSPAAAQHEERGEKKMNTRIGRIEPGERWKEILFLLPHLSPPLMDSYKDWLNVMMCKMRKMSPLVEGGRGRWRAAI